MFPQLTCNCAICRSQSHKNFLAGYGWVSQRTVVMISILTLGDRSGYHLYCTEKDMNTGFNLLCSIVLNELGKQFPKSGAFIFIYMPRTYLKLLLDEHCGFIIFYRRLEKGAFEVQTIDLDTKSMKLSASWRHFMLQGIVRNTK